MDYQFKKIESEWQQFWAENQTFKVENHSTKPKYYVMDMFPYPSGAGLHVGHPLGYIASDIFARYKRLKGFNVLHPMGYDSFGLPAEQYAIQTGQHPAITTEQNIATYRRQLDQIGFSFDWSREVRTSSPDYYKWTQWIFMQLFNSWYNLESDKAESISTLIQKFEVEGNTSVKAASDDDVLNFSSEEWAAFSDIEKQEELLKYRLTYLRESTVNWCAALGTVLANDEVKDGFSERGGYPVEQKKMMQWSMRITAYAERLLQGLDTIDWPEPLKEMQRNWIGKSVGAMVRFGISLANSESLTLNPSPKERDLSGTTGVASSVSAADSLSSGEGRGEALNRGDKAPFIEVFTTRVDTTFGVTFVVLAPEHELVKHLTTPDQQEAIDAYIDQAKKKSELDRMADTKTVSGAFTGSYVINPLDGTQIPVWIADYVLAGYGTGAVMGVPSGDARDHRFATHFNLPIVAILDTQKEVLKEADATKEGRYINSGFINGMTYKEATTAVIAKLEELGAGKAKINYRQRDAVFGRQRYWGEPVPVYFKDGLPRLISESELPLVLPEVDKYLPTESGEPPLARAEGWSYRPSLSSLTLNPSPEERDLSDTTGVASSTGAANSLSSGEGWGEAGYATADPKLWDIFKLNSRENRQNQTEAESLLWQHLRDNQTGYKIRRQHAVGSYIADFICLKKALIIEIDGGYHQEITEQDELRTQVLNELGFEVVRFTNDEVAADIDKVIKTIKNKLDNQPESYFSAATSFSPGESRGEAQNQTSYPYELSTMPGWAGSSWYWYRYMDAQNQQEFASKEAIAYWKDVDLYIGGSEHATGHLLYSRFWNKFLKDLGLVEAEEPFKKLINQGMIQGRSSFVYWLTYVSEGAFGKTFISYEFVKQFEIIFKKYEKLENIIFPLESNILQKANFLKMFSLEEMAFLNHFEKILFSLDNSNISSFKFGRTFISSGNVDVNIVQNDILDIDKFRASRKEYANAEFLLENGKYICGHEVEKMSKSKFNVVNPDEMIERYGADTLRMYEMFLGPLEQSKPWNTNGIEGVFKFLRKFWKLFHDDAFNFRVINEAATKAELKSLHKIIKKVEDDVERFSFNTSVSSFMIAVNELTELKCAKRSILQDMVVILSPYAPHICEELWKLLGNEAGSLSYTAFPKFNPEFLVEDAFSYPISINGKTKTNLSIPLSLDLKEVETLVLADENVQKYLNGQTPKKVIVVKGRIVNMVV